MELGCLRVPADRILRYAASTHALATHSEAGRPLRRVSASTASLRARLPAAAIGWAGAPQQSTLLAVCTVDEVGAA